MLLSDLYASGADDGPEITGLAADSRAVKSGTLFAALKGVAADGADFIPEAIARGAAAVLAEPGAAPSDTKIPVIEDQNPRRALAIIAAKFFGPQPQTAVAVTGTNGKTSVAGFTRQIWQRLGLKSACLGTLGVSWPERAPGSASHHPGADRAAPGSGRPREIGGHPCCPGSLQSRAEPIAPGRHPDYRRGFYQFVAGSSGLPPDGRSLFGRENAACSPLSCQPTGPRF